MSEPNPNNDNHICLSHVSRRFMEGQQVHTVLNDVCAVFPAGQVVAIRGRSGSGKSTLLNLISGIDKPDSGEIEVAGKILNRMSEHELTLFRRRNVGFIYQAFNLVPTLTVSDNIRLVLELNRVAQEEADRRIVELLSAVELPDRADSYPDLLSGGEQQRVAIARALCHRPSILLADEPTGNLDDRSAIRVLRLLDALIKQNGATMIVATHSATVADWCGRVLELHHGKLLPPREQRDGS